MLGIVLALCSSLSWGVSDFIGGLQARRLPLARVMLVGQASGLIWLSVILLALGRGAPSLAHLLPAAAGGLSGLVGLTSFYRGLAVGTMSIVAPISATGVAVPVIVGVAGGEHPAALQVLGIVAAAVGIVLASREHGPGRPDSSPGRAGIGLALVAAVGFGGFFVGVRESARYDALWAVFGARAAAVAALVLVAAVVPRAVRRGRGGWAALCAVGALDVGANVLYAIASRHGLLSVVSVVSSLYPVATVLLARGFLNERVRRVQELGIVAALAGVVLIAAG